MPPANLLDHRSSHIVQHQHPWLAVLRHRTRQHKHGSLDRRHVELGHALLPLPLQPADLLLSRAGVNLLQSNGSYDHLRDVGHCLHMLFEGRAALLQITETHRHFHHEAAAFETPLHEAP
jgi:hypothetical protein